MDTCGTNQSNNGAENDFSLVLENRRQDVVHIQGRMRLDRLFHSVCQREISLHCRLIEMWVEHAPCEITDGQRQAAKNGAGKGGHGAPTSNPCLPASIKSIIADRPLFGPPGSLKTSQALVLQRG